MSDRNQAILRYLIKNRTMKEEELLHTFELTPRKLSYSIESLNEKLAEHHLPLIEKSQGTYYAKQTTRDFFTLFHSSENIVFDKRDRVFLLVIVILTRREALSLDHLVASLGVSKNTVMSDIKEAKYVVAKFDLTLEFSRKAGYTILGREWFKRLLLVETMTEIYRTYGDQVIQEMSGLDRVQVDKAKEKVIQIEKYLGIKYVDEDFYPLIYSLTAISQRIAEGKEIQQNDISDDEEIKHTPEYQAITYVLEDQVGLSDVEKNFVTLQFLGANVRNRRMITAQELPLLANSLWEFLSEFEAKTLFVLTEKKELLTKLLNHFKPAYYRIKYHLEATNVLFDKIISEYSVLHDFVRQSLAPLNRFFGTEIADQEVAYITLFIGGHLLNTEQKELDEKTIRAVILCPNGMTMSKLMEKQLKTIFPEFLFYPTSTIREYSAFMLPHDVVFSTVPVASTKKVFVSNEILGAEEKKRLRTQVIKELFHLEYETIDTNQILAVVKKQVALSATQEKKIAEQLALLWVEQLKPSGVEATSPVVGLKNLLDTEIIRYVPQAASWEELLQLVSQPLIKRGQIDESYLNHLLEQYRHRPEYILLKQQLVLPHVDPQLIPQQLGVSLLVLKEGLLYNGTLVHLVVLLTTPDRTSHLTVLYDIMEIAKNTELMNQLKTVESAKEAQELLLKFLQKKENDE